MPEGNPKPMPMLSAQSGDAGYQSDDTFMLGPVLLQYWHAILRWRLIILGIIGACLIASILITLLMSPLYTAKTQVEISREQKNVTNVESLESRQEGRELEFYETQYTLLKARSLAERVARKLNLSNSREFFEAHGMEFAGADTSAKSPLSAAEREKRERQTVALLLKNIDVLPIQNSRLVDITYTSRSPKMSAMIANTWTQEFIGGTMDRQFASTADARKFLESRLATLRERLEQSEREVVNYASSNDIVTLDTTRDSEGRTFTERTLASSDLEALNQALMAARADRIAAESRNGTGSADNTSEFLSNTSIGQLRARRAEAAAEYAKLMVRFEPGYPAARALKEQIDAFDAAISREANRVEQNRRLGYVEALKREQELEARVRQLKAGLDTQRKASIQYNIYQREADTNRQLYDALLQRYKEIGVAGTVGASNIVVVDPANVPIVPSSPNLLLNLAIAILLGTGIAAIAVLGLEQIDEGIRNPDDVTKYLGAPLLGNVPMSKEAPQEELADPKSSVSEAYFSVRSTLAFATNHGLPRSLAVSSTRQSEGKSTTALALAEVIGRTGQKVLLIDGDMRSPSQHHILGLRNDAGLSNLLAGEDQTTSLIRETNKRGIEFIPAGPIPPSPAELLSSDRLAVLVQSFLETYDHVIIDSPPVLGLADSPLIGHAVEGVVFVIEAEQTPRRAARAALQRLRHIGNHIFGVVVTKVDLTRHNYGYGYGYGYGFGYGYGEDGEKSTVKRA